MSMKPGATTIPRASMLRHAGAPESRPIAAILPARIPTSAAYHGEPVPSITWPLWMTRSKGGKAAAAASANSIKWRMSVPLKAKIKRDLGARPVRLLVKRHRPNQLTASHNAAFGVVFVKIAFEKRIGGEIQLRHQRL